MSPVERKTEQVRIAIDVTPLQNGHCHRGVGEYARRLLGGLAQVDDVNDYLLFGYPGDLPDLPTDGGRFKVIQSGPAGDESLWLRLRWHQYALPRLLIKNKADILHILVQSFDINIPVWSPIRPVVTIHDLKAELFPNLYLTNVYKRLSYALMLKLASRAPHIITDSESSKRDILERMDVARERVSVIPLAADPVYFSKPPQAIVGESSLTAKYNLAAKFILFVGAIEPSKNIGTLLAAYDMLLEQGFRHQLVLVGIQNPKYYGELQREFGHLFGERVRFLDPIPQSELRDLYRKAELFVYPSLYEGFGLPVLEAMASGTPVITSNISSLPEVTGSAALLFDPQDKSKLAKYIWDICHNENARSDLAIRGRSRARGFSWDQCAKQTLRVYRQVMESGGKN